MSTALPEAFTADVVAQQQAAAAQAAAATTTPTVFTEDEVRARIEAARVEEKDKLYSRMDSLEKRLAREAEEREASRKEAESAAEAQAKAEEDARRASEEEDLSAKEMVQRQRSEFQKMLDEKEQNWKQELDQEKKRREASEALVERERQFNELRDYTEATVQANQNLIAPQLLSWIKGNSKEEIDETVARAVATTEALTQDLQRVAQEQRLSLPGTRVTSGPTDFDPSASTQQLSAEQISNMSMPEYAKYRKQLIGASSQQNKGMYG